MSNQKRNYKAFVFDLDGTLINSAPDIAVAVNRYLIKHGYEEQTTSYIEKFIGQGAKRLLQTLFSELNLLYDRKQLDEACREYLDNYRQSPAKLTTLYPYVKEDLTALKKLGIRLGICTNKNQSITDEVLTKLGIDSLFDVAIGADSVPFCKPAPEHLQAVVDQMQLDGIDWAYIGDNMIDQQAALVADVPFYAVSWGRGRQVKIDQQQRLMRILDLIKDE